MSFSIEDFETTCCDGDDTERRAPRTTRGNCQRCEIDEQRQSAAILLVGMRNALRVLMTIDGASDEFRLAVAKQLWSSFHRLAYPLPPIPKADA